MDFNNFRIERAIINKFKNLSDLAFDFSANSNILFGKERSGKSSILEFIEYMLYGTEKVSLSKNDASHISGELYVFSGQNEFKIIRKVSEEETVFSFITLKDSKEVMTDLTPGEYLSGLSPDEFGFLSYFEQSRYGLPKANLNDNILKKIAQKRKSTQFLNYFSIYEKLLEFHNPQNNGHLDKYDAEKKSLADKISSEETIKSQIDAMKNEISDGIIKIEENEKRIVILKADMSQYDDDSKLDENIKNAFVLKNAIREKEKKLNILDYELQNKTGKFSKESLDSLKNEYNTLSILLTKSAELRNKLDAANESLNYHRQLFNNKDSISHYGNLKNKIKKYHTKSKAFIICSILFFVLSPAVFFLLKMFDYSPSISIFASAAMLLSGVAFLMLNYVSKVYIKYTLLKAGAKSENELNDICEKLSAHNKTDKVYTEQIKEINNQYKNNVFETDKLRNSISQMLKNAGRSLKGEDILEVCDEVIESNSAFYDLEDEIELDKANRDRILLKDIDSDNPELSNEYQLLQKELDFVQRQNDSLIKKRAILESDIAELELQLPDKEKILLKLAEIDEKSRPFRARYDELCAELLKLKSDKDAFVSKIKEEILGELNSSLSYIKDTSNESYSFDENSELCFTEADNNIPLARFGNGIAEMGIMTFRICVSNMMGHKKIPLLLDDIFKNKAEESFMDFIKLLENNSSQIIISTSSNKIYEQTEDKLNCIIL